MGAAHWTGSSHAAGPSTGAAGSQISQITVPTRDQIFSAFSDKSVLFNNDDDRDPPTFLLIPIYMMISILTPIKTSQELRMLSSVTINCQAIKIVSIVIRVSNVTIHKLKK